MGVWAHHQLPALLCTLLEDAGVDLLWKDPALLSLLPSWDLPVHTSTMREPHPSPPQVSAEPCSSGGSSPVCWAGRKFSSEREWSSPAMFTHHSVPGSPPLSCTPIFVGTGGASHFSERPCKVKNKTAKTSPLAWTQCPGSAQTQLRVPPLFPCCDKVARGSCSDPTPPGRAANNNSEGLTCGAGWGGGRSRAGVGSSPPRRWKGSP